MSIVMSESTRTAWKKHEGRCSGAYFFFTVCEIHFSGFVHFTFFWLYQSIGFEGNIMYAKKVLRRPHNALTLQDLLLLRDK